VKEEEGVGMEVGTELGDRVSPAVGETEVGDKEEESAAVGCVVDGARLTIGFEGAMVPVGNDDEG